MQMLMPWREELRKNVDAISTGTRVPSFRMYSFSWGRCIPLARSSAILTASIARWSGAVSAFQSILPASSSARV
jgi:hypothetical protein